MSYTNAIFYLDYTTTGNGDAARVDLVPSAYANNGVGLVRVTVGGLGATPIVTDAVVTIAGTTGSVYVGDWKVTVIDANNIDLQGSTYTSNPATKGTCVPFGGANWADAWKTITAGATAARVAPGDVVRIAKSPVPTAVGNATWTSLNKTVTFTALTSCAFTDKGDGVVRVTKTAHGFSSNDVVTVSGSTSYDGNWVITVISSSVFDLVGSTYSADRSGTVSP